MISMLRKSWVALVFMGLLPSVATAQTLIEVAAGYNVVNYRAQDVMPVGWSASITAKPANWFAVTSELSAEFNTDKTASVPVQKQAFVFLDGPRFILNNQLRMTLFGEVLLGVAHDREFLTDRSGANHFVWQPGAGLDIKLSESVSARFQIGARYRTCCDLNSPSAVRFLSGLVFTSTPSEEAKAKAAVFKEVQAKVDIAQAAARYAEVAVRKATGQANNAVRLEQKTQNALLGANTASQRAEANLRSAKNEALIVDASKDQAKIKNAKALVNKARAAADQAKIDVDNAKRAAEKATTAIEKAESDRKSAITEEKKANAAVDKAKAEARNAATNWREAPLDQP